MNLSKKDRLIISNQFKILERLDPVEADYYANQRKAIEHGYELHYDWLAENMYDGLSREECQEVLEILSMYRSFDRSFHRLDDKEDLSEEAIRFDGFDGNNETNQYSYVRYFILDLGRFDELAYNAEATSFNSNCPMLEIYRRRISVWNEYENKLHLQPMQIKSILEA